MEKEQIIIERFGLCPSEISYAEIKQLLVEEIENHDHSEGCGEYLRVLCFMIFYCGHVEDCELIWKAKNLNFDTGWYIDGELLFGAGYNKTLDYISEKTYLNNMKSYIEEYIDCECIFEKEDIIKNFKSFYRC